MQPRGLPCVPIVPSQQNDHTEEDRNQQRPTASTFYDPTYRAPVQPRRQTLLNDSEPQSRRECEEILAQFIGALNRKDLKLSTWNRIAPNIRISWGLFLLEKDGEKALTLQEWLPIMRLLAKASPNYHFRIFDITTVVDERAGTAESVMNAELSGVFEGIVRKSVVGVGFVRREGKWEAVRNGSFAGPGIS